MSSRIGHRTRLYRKAALAVTFAVALLVALLVPGFAQYAKKRQVSKGPRAVGLLELAANGKAHLIAVSIMIDGKFYDASAYKADPVPMALQPDTVYEGVKSGAPQGLFTVAGAIPQKDAWVADGKWKSEADIEADKARAKAEAAKKAYKAPEDSSGPPKLRRAPNSGSDSSSQTQPASSAPSTKDQTAPASGSATNSKPTSEDKPSAKNSRASESSGQVDAPDRPILRRQAPSETTQEQTKTGNDVEPLSGPIQLIPAVSDSGGPEARPYTYELKPDEQQKFLKGMLAMASDEVEARAAHLRGESETPANRPAKAGSRATSKSAAKGPAPEFQDVQLKIFDLTSSNEPVLVFTANASIPNSKLNLRYTIALIAREDIYAELHKVFAQTTDDQHLDVLPKYEFIDAVDADGDGRGELLFRTTSASGQAFSIYAVIGDRLWPLFEGKPGA